MEPARRILNLRDRHAAKIKNQIAVDLTGNPTTVATKGVHQINGQQKTEAILPVPAAESTSVGRGGFFFGKPAGLSEIEFRRWHACRRFF